MEYFYNSIINTNCNNPHFVVNMIKNNPQSDTIFMIIYPQSVTLIYIFTTHINIIN